MSQVLEHAYDLHAGLAGARVPEFDQLEMIGMAATLALHIKGLAPIDFEILRKVSDHFIGIPSFALRPVLEILEEARFVSILSSGKTIKSVIPDIPIFDNVYAGLGDYASSELSFNEQEVAIVELLSHLSKAPQNKDTVFNSLGMQRELFDRTLVVGTKSGIISSQRARGREILISPYHFVDNLEGLADAAASAGASNLQKLLEKLGRNQGWPMSLAISQKEIGGFSINPTEVALMTKLAAEGMIKPPTINFGQKSESFLFTPSPGGTRLNASNREIYERAMALISAVRKGQLLPEKIAIRSPLAILRSLRDTGYLRSNSEADKQYQNLVQMRVGTLKPTGFGRSEFHLNATEENQQAIDLAIRMLATGQVSGMEVDQEARIALTKDDSYIQSLISASNLKTREKQISDPEAAEEFTQLMLKFDT